MRKCTSRIAAIVLTLMFSPVCAAIHGAASEGSLQSSEVTSFDSDWRFHLGDVDGAQAPAFDAAAWRQLDVPHDWMIEGPFDRTSPAGAGGGYLNGGVGWYRKTFTLPEAARGCNVFVRFDGVYMDSDVWLNGHHLGNRPYGYTSFQYELTPHLKFGENENVLAVRCNVRQPCSRWYSGAGIYRHVWLSVCNPVHFAECGTCVTTPEVSDGRCKIRVRTRVCNQGTQAALTKLTTAVVDPDGKMVGVQTMEHKIAAGKEYEFDQTFSATDVRVWSLEAPNLYYAGSRVGIGNQSTEARMTPFGIRTIRFTPEDGFFLNDKPVRIKGVCGHHDAGCLGTAVNRRAIERQLEILKSMGCNAIRTSHNPPAPELLELCDQMGFLVIDEAFDEWKEPKSKYGYGRFFDKWSERDLVSMIRRDRNHPCIILWSIGNEILEQKSVNGEAMATRLADICRREDPSRPVTAGCDSPSVAFKTGFAKPLDLIGINYRIKEYALNRGKVLYASETAPPMNSRGEYNLVPGQDGKLEIKRELNNQCTTYDMYAPEWADTAQTSLLGLKNSPWVIGEFIWTGFDYIGEPTPLPWPARSSYFGIVDLCGFPKDRYYLHKSVWTDEPLVHVLPHWNWEGFEGKEIPVWCYTNADAVELFLNGKSLGEKSGKDIKQMHYEWSVPYVPGVLKAVARRGGKQIAVDEVHTAGKPAKVLLVPDRTKICADGRDLSFVQVRIVDREGRLCPNANDQIKFAISGPGRIAGVDNGDPTSHESFQGHTHRAFHGLGLVVVQSDRRAGDMRLEASADSLTGAAVSISSGPPQ